MQEARLGGDRGVERGHRHRTEGRAEGHRHGAEG